MKLRQLLLAALSILDGGSFSEQRTDLSSNHKSVESHSSGSITSRINEYCFKPSPSFLIGVQRDSTTPKHFLSEHENVEAVVNGVYFGEDFTPLGIAYVNGHEYANGNRNQTRGYFSIDRKGKIQVGERLSPKLKQYTFVIGTQPLLITGGIVHKQAKETRYKLNVAYRSAIGTKNDDICFVVSKFPVRMQPWAEILKNEGYEGALNLDGGPVSQLAVRKDNKLSDYGIGIENTQLVIYASRK
ncbi:MAG: phosphodiester glycosidase family protein [Candidatus Woesearchaeota archaeon]